VKQWLCRRAALERRDSSLRSSAGLAGCCVLSRARSFQLPTLPASSPRDVPSHPCCEHRSTGASYATGSFHMINASSRLSV
jgi:hypothetical protein